MSGKQNKKRPAKRSSPPGGGRAGEPPKISRAKLWGFRLFGALGVPLLFLIVLELALRLAGFGYPTGFLLSFDNGGQKMFVQNNRFGWRFFSPVMAREPVPICVPRVKSPGTIRIVVFGESAAEGDPLPAFGLPRMLQALLELRYPGTKFEVINAGITAIDSHVVLPIARDCAAADADFWVVYMGNNEVVGPYGAGTVFGPQVPPMPLIHASLALKATRTGQLMDAVQRRLNRPPVDKMEWGGMEMFLNQQVRADDVRMSGVYNHFAQNLRDIIKAGRHSGAAVVVSTVAVNLRDCAPFGSEHRPDLSAADLARWREIYQKGVTAQVAGNIQAAMDAFAAAAKMDDGVADLHFRLGECALAAGRPSEAQSQFAAARDLDTLRFRCDSRLNALIRQTTADCQDPRVVLADSEKSFADASPDGLPGDNLFYEHVHLNFHGNYLLARTLAANLETLLPPAVAAGHAALQPWPPETACAQRLAWTDWERQAALMEVYSRLTKPPFTGQMNHDAQMQKLEASLEELAPAARPAGIQAAEQACQSALAMAPDDPLVRKQLVQLQELSGDLNGAATNAELVVAQLPASSEDWSAFGVAQAKQEKYAGAIAAFRRAFELDSQDVWVLQNLAQSLNDLGQPDQAIQEYKHALMVNPRFGLAWLGMGQIYEKAGHQAQAQDCYRKALANRINRPQELTTLARFCENRGWYEAAATNFVDAVKLNPSDATLWLAAGRNFAAAGRHAPAMEYLAQAASLLPDTMEAHFLYGLELGRDGKPADAAKQFREAVRIMPNLIEARLNLGVALENAGDYSGALEQFDLVLQQDPSNALARDHRNVLSRDHSVQPQINADGRR